MFKNIDDAINIMDNAFIKAEADEEFNGNEFQTTVNECVKQFPNDKKYFLDHYKNFVNCGLADDKNEYGFVCFAEAIVSIYNDINDLPLLLSYFDDSKDPEWAFDSLVTTIEKYYLAHLPYIEVLLKNIEILTNKAPSWAGRLVSRILSKQEAYDIFKQNSSKANKKNLIYLLEYMKCHEDDFDYVFSQIDELLQSLKD